MRRLNRLEELGWALVAASKLDIPAGQARMLQVLAVKRPGALCSYAELNDALVRNPQDRPKTPVALRVATKIAALRKALTEVGFQAGDLSCVDRRGYVLSHVASRRVQEMVERGALGIAA